MRDLILKFILGFVVFFLIHTIIYFIIFISNIEIFECGNDILNDRSQQNILFFSCICIFIFQSSISWILIRNKVNKVVGFVGLFFIIPALFLSIKIGPKGLIKSNYYTVFTEVEWKDKEKRTPQMIRYIINEGILKNMTSSEIRKKLGEPDFYNKFKDTSYVYFTQSAFMPIEISFRNDTVNKIDIQCKDF